MKYISQFLYILLFTLLGELLQALIPIPIPAAIYSIILLLIALSTGLLKEEKVADAASFLISLLPLLFIAPTVKILQYWGLIAPWLAQICIIVVISTFLVFTVSGLITQWLGRKKEGKRND